MPFHRQQPDTLSKPCAVYEHEGMSLCVCAELQLDNSTVTRHFNACPSRSCVTSPPPQPLRPHCRVWSRLDVELLVGCRLSTGLTLISVSFFPAQHICMSLCLFLLRPVRLCVLFLWFFALNPIQCRYSCVIFLCQTRQSSAILSQHRSRWWRMTLQLCHCCSLLTHRRSPASGCITKRSWSKVIPGYVMAL